MRCDALLLDEEARTDTYPSIQINEDHVQISHEATVCKVGEEQLFYLHEPRPERGRSLSMIINGFIEPITKEIPLEYAVELNRLIQLADGRLHRLSRWTGHSKGDPYRVALSLCPPHPNPPPETITCSRSAQPRGGSSVKIMEGPRSRDQERPPHRHATAARLAVKIRNQSLSSRLTFQPNIGEVRGRGAIQGGRVPD